MIDEQNESQQPAEAVQEGTQDTELVAATETGQAEPTAPKEPAEPVSKPDDEYNQRVQNWRALREKASQAEKLAQEHEELKKRLAQYENQPQKDQPTEEEFNLSDDDLVEAKHLKKVEKKIASRYEKELNNIKSEMAESRLRADLPDYYEVVTKDTLGMLKDADPDLAQSILSNPNPVSQAKAAYRAVKMYGFAPTDAHKKQHAKVQANNAKPRPLSSVSPQQGESPLSRANAFAEGLTPDLQKQLWQEMVACRKK